MYKKTLLSMAVASTLTLTGCLDDGGSGGSNANPDYKITNPYSDGNTSVVFNPVTSELPIPNDLLFDSEQGDGTFGLTPDPTNPAITALNELSGASTVAPFDIEISGFIDPATVNGTEVILSSGAPIPNPAQTVFLLELEYASGDPVQGLSNREIPTVWNAVRFGAASFDPSAPDPVAGQAAGLYSGVADPVLGAQEAQADLLALAQAPAYEAVVKELDGTSYIRINPIKPLNPRKRYVVVVTDGVLDTSGNPVTQSTTYQNLTDETQALGSASLAPVRALINGLWESTAVGYFDAVANLTRPDAPLSEDSIAMSISMTTSVDVAVPYYMAEPAFWISDRLEDSVKVGAAKAALEDGATTFGEVYQAVQIAYGSWMPGDLGDGSLAGCNDPSLLPPMFQPDPPYENDAESRFQCAATFLFQSLEGNGINFPNPEAVTTTFDPATTRDVLQASALISPLATAGGWGADTVNVVEGTMTIPYYLGAPNGEDGSPLVTNNWTADNDLATQLNGFFASQGLELVIPQADPSVTTAVNYLFPFPKKTADQTIPILAMYPSATVGASFNDSSITPVIYQHGITTDRTAALAYGASMVAGAAGQGKPIAVIAIDQPLHGIAPVSTEEQLDLAATLLTAADQDPANAQAVVDGVFSTGVLQQIDAVCPNISVDFTDPNSIAAATNDVINGGVCGPVAQAQLAGALVLESTVANGGSIIPGFAATTDERHFDFSADENNQPAPMDFDPESAFGSSGSLFINLSNFLATRDNLRQQINDLLTLRLSLAEVDLGGDASGFDLKADETYFIGHSLGTVNGIPFVAVANDTTTGDDDIVAANMLTPGGGVVRLVENSPSLAPPVLAGIQGAAGLTQGDADLESFFNVLQATVDTADSVNYISAYATDEDNYKVLLSEVIGDTTIPNSAYPEPNFGDASASPTAGTEPLITFSVAGDILDSTLLPSPPYPGDAYTLTQNAVRYTAGFHGTPVYPSNGTTEEEVSGEQAVFAEMVGQSTSMVLTGGAGVVVSNTDVIQD